MVICSDTSFLFSLYGNDGNTARAIKWVKDEKKIITVTSFNECELGNALRFAEFRKAIALGEAAVFWAQYESDRDNGRIVMEVCNLAMILDEARRLSVTHTLTGGHRGFDILHVAAALQLGAGVLLTFDANQRKLALGEGLVVLD
jgi:predicted nucleic acid-binding protein